MIPTPLLRVAAIILAASLAHAQDPPKKDPPKPDDDLTNPITGSKPAAKAPPADKAAEAPAKPDDKAPPKPVIVTAGAITFEAPPAWPVETPTKSMFTPAAQFTLPAADPKAAENAQLKVFTGIKGGVGPNLERWKGQVSSPVAPAKEKTLTVNGIKVHTLSITGTFSAGMMGQPAEPKTNWTILGAIAELDSGDVQFKAVGPAEVLEHHSKAWDAMLHSIKPAK